MKNMEEDERLLEGLKGLSSDIGDLMKTSKKLNEFRDMILPKEKFMAEIDGRQMEVSIAMNGIGIVLVFNNQNDCREIFDGMKENKKGFFKRIFNTK